MEVVRNLPHVVVDDPAVTESIRRRVGETGQHVVPVLSWRVHAVPTPHHHRGLADLALGDPADVVLVEPRRYPFRLAQLAIGDPDRSHRTESTSPDGPGRWARRMAYVSTASYR